MMKRSESGRLIPTKTTGALHHYKYVVSRGTVSDKLFRLDQLDPLPRPTRKRTVETIDIGQEEDVYEVEAIRAKRVKGKSFQYEVKWRGWSEDLNTWEPPSHISQALVAAFNGQPAPPTTSPKLERISLPARGAGCARARLSSAEEARGGKPETISMVCRNVIIHLKQPKDHERMPTASFTFFVLSMDKNGHIIWPTTFDAKTQAYLRNQARALLQKMMDDPNNPVDSTMAPALTGRGTGNLWQGAPQKKLVRVQMVA